MRVTNEVKARVKATLDICVAKANARYPNQTFRYPTVKYTKRGTTAGTANDSTYSINLNAVLLMENTDLFMGRTVIHEFGHLVDGIVNPDTRESNITYTRSGKLKRTKRSLHGPTWKAIMRMLGGPTTTTHSYDTTNSKVKKRGQAKHVWTCSCGSLAGKMVIGGIRHKKMIANDSVRYWMRGHKHHTYTYVGVEGAPRPVARTLPKAANAAGRTTKKVTKLDKCRDSFSTVSSRELMINTFMQVAGCTQAGAATYYAKIKKERGL